MSSQSNTSVFYHRRTARRIEAAKKKARSELNKCGWQTDGYAFYNSVGTIDQLPDTIERVDWSELTLEKFVEKYEKPGIPVIITGLTDKWQAQQKWNLPRLYRKYRNQKFKCGEDDEGYSVKIKMKYYIDYMCTTKDDSPLYIFDSSFGERPKTKKLLEDYEVPPMFKDDLFNYASDKRRPPYRWIVIGPARSGTGIHIDPLGTSAWNALIVGNKRWCLIHPTASKQLVKPSKEDSGKHVDEAINWFHTVYSRILLPSWYNQYPTIHAVQKPNEVMFVPSGWWHVVLNLDNTIAVTQNFCSFANLHKVWPKTVKGRPKLSTHWLKSLRENRPEVASLIKEINAQLNWKSLNATNNSSDSSSSSSSSSSSNSSDSEDSGTELEKKKSNTINFSSEVSKSLSHDCLKDKNFSYWENEFCDTKLNCEENKKNCFNTENNLPQEENHLNLRKRKTSDFDENNVKDDYYIKKFWRSSAPSPN